MNRAVALHNTPRICPAVGRVFIDMYQSDTPLLLDGGEVMQSREGTYQGNPLAMAFYVLALIPLVRHLQEVCPSAGQVRYADNDAAADKVLALLSY